MRRRPGSRPECGPRASSGTDFHCTAGERGCSLINGSAAFRWVALLLASDSGVLKPGNLRHVCTNARNDPLIVSGHHTLEGCDGVRRRTRAEDLSRQHVRFTEQGCAAQFSWLSTRPAQRDRLPCKSSVFPEPSFPQMRDSWPIGKRTLRPRRMNFLLGVDATDDEALPPRSCGHVIVAELSAIVRSCSPRGGTGDTSDSARYFSMRRAETRLCSQRQRESAPMK